MLAYDGTPVKAQLKRTGRLRGDVVHPDYDFLYPEVTELYYSLSNTVDVWGWVHGYQGLSPRLNWAWNEVAILARLFPALAGFAGYCEVPASLHPERIMDAAIA